jgi:hypothetical protein
VGGFVYWKQQKAQSPPAGAVLKRVYFYDQLEQRKIKNQGQAFDDW